MSLFSFDSWDCIEYFNLFHNLLAKTFSAIKFCMYTFLLHEAFGNEILKIYQFHLIFFLLWRWIFLIIIVGNFYNFLLCRIYQIFESQIWILADDIKLEDFFVSTWRQVFDIDLFNQKYDSTINIQTSVV